MKRILYTVLIGASVLMVSCKKNLTDLNNNPKQPEVVPSATLFTNASVSLADVCASPNVNTNIFRFFAQQWAETTYPDETNYDLDGRSIPDRWFGEFYRDIIKDLDEAGKVLETEKGPLSDAVYKNRQAQIQLLTVYSYYHLVTTFGNIPFSEALNADIPAPKYDDAAGVYDQLITNLDAALALIDDGAEGYGSADPILDGDMAAWKMFGNSLKLRMGMLIADVDASKASTLVLAANANVPASNADNLMIHFLSAPPNTNPVWEDIVQSGRFDFIAANTFMDKLKALNDPRIPLFFEKNGDGNYVGGIYGSANTYALFSAPIAALSAPDFPHTFFSYAEMEFLKAEAVERGIAVGGTAAEHYNNAVTASIKEWGGSDADAAAYLAQPSVAYATAAGTYKEKIGVQSWIALYDRGYDAWTQWRRLDYPVLVPGPDNLSDGVVPTRYTYPVVEQNLNKKNYEAASTAIGGDKMGTKLWFDKF